MVKRKRFTKEFRAKAAIEALKGQRSLQEPVKEYGIHPYLLKEIEIDRPNRHDYETAAEPVVGLRT